MVNFYTDKEKKKKIGGAAAKGAAGVSAAKPALGMPTSVPKAVRDEAERLASKPKTVGTFGTAAGTGTAKPAAKINSLAPARNAAGSLENAGRTGNALMSEESLENTGKTNNTLAAAADEDGKASKPYEYKSVLGEVKVDPIRLVTPNGGSNLPKDQEEELTAVFGSVFDNGKSWESFLKRKEAEATKETRRSPSGGIQGGIVAQAARGEGAAKPALGMPSDVPKAIREEAEKREAERKAKLADEEQQAADGYAKVDVGTGFLKNYSNTVDDVGYAFKENGKDYTVYVLDADMYAGAVANGVDFSNLPENVVVAVDYLDENRYTDKADPSMQIINSYRISDEETQRKICGIIIDYAATHTSGGTPDYDRSVDSMVHEWRIHNDDYKKGKYVNSTKDTDFNNECEGKSEEEILLEAFVQRFYNYFS
ncbi:MAG: hypothetical protein GX683_00225 [Ruminococcaceae bacterium]|nr:hypothetical protein [Oscillospiraceae bacterium]